MQNLPIEFSDTDVVVNPSCHFSFNFDLISSIELGTLKQLDIQQTNPIKALQISLAGRTSNPNMSISIDSVTRLFTLNSVYITDTYPRKANAAKELCFVIEGYSIENVNKEKILVFLPMKPTNTTNNLFYPLETAINNQTQNQEINLNHYIPTTNIATDYYSYYRHTDDVGCLFHVVFFANSSLGYTSAFTVVATPAGYASEENMVIHKSSTLALHHNNMNNQFEDNIYIDCVPVDVVNQTEEKYMQINQMNATYFTDMLMVLSYMIALSLLVYGIYYFYIYMSSPKKVTT